METQRNTGWRRLVPAAVELCSPVDNVEKNQLFHLAHLAVDALRLRPALRFVLEQLVGCFQEPINGRLLVWPSNEFLEQRTGMPERSIRYALSNLIAQGLITSKDSANGKRFAIRSKAGQIIDAYGLDLSPLLARAGELEAMQTEIRIAREIRGRQFDEITICRRATQEALRALEEWFAETPRNDLQRTFDALVRMTPRRAGKASPESPLAVWRDLRDQAEARYRAACGGKNRRLIENNNDTPDQSCNKSPRGNDEPEVIQLIDLAAACPDAFAYAGEVGDERDLVAAAARLRGMFGAHESAWTEAIEKLGPVRAAAAFFVVLQVHDAGERSGKRIKNPGGYFRSFSRMIAGGQISLVDEIRAMKRRRHH